MGNIINLRAEEQAEIIGDDAQPTLTISNMSTGASLHLEREATGIVAGNATVGQPLEIAPVSVASGAFIKITGGLVSASTILATTGGVAGTYVLRVVKPDGTFGWIPVYPDGAVTAAAL